MFPDDLLDLAEALRGGCVGKGLILATAESCTGGLIAGCLTSISGSSAMVDRGFVTYTNEAKTELLGVPAGLIADHGAVSEPVARAMADGALARSRAHIALAVTGIAGPNGGSPAKPVGLVYLAAASRSGETRVERHIFPGNRTEVRLATVKRALEMALEVAG